MDHADLRQQLVRQANRLQPLGLATGTSGNLSVRVDGGMLITPSGIAYETLQPEDMVPVQFTGPGTAEQDVPADRLAAVLSAFRAELPDQRLPFGVAPTSQGARGSDVIIEGITEGVIIRLNGFRQS